MWSHHRMDEQAGKVHIGRRDKGPLGANSEYAGGRTLSGIASGKHISRMTPAVMAECRKVSQPGLYHWRWASYFPGHLWLLHIPIFYFFYIFCFPLCTRDPMLWVPY